MNLKELDELLNHPEVQKDTKMLEYYTKRRAELIAAIQSDIKAIFEKE